MLPFFNTPTSAFVGSDSFAYDASAEIGVSDNSQALLYVVPAEAHD
jgi:hypothetical protein